MKNDPVSPNHYQFGGDVFAVAKITDELSYNRGNVVKYAARAGRKCHDTELEDLKKAMTYLTREIANLEDAQ